ncbi:MAG TPA: hypothetical protein VFQ61_00715 [Polyangiaceae bacterium]|nr:hypothetical protein [Polyangiaceae bacterium]
MSQAARVAGAFAELERHTVQTRAVLQRVLLQAITDPHVIAATAEAPLADYLRVLGRSLETLPIRVLHVCPVLPDFGSVAHHFTAATRVAAEAHVQSLPRPLRERVLWVASSAQPELNRLFGESADLALFSRLAGLALADLPFLVHVLEGEPVEPFLTATSSAPPQSASRMRASRKPGN